MPATCAEAGTAERCTCENCSAASDKDKRETTAEALAIPALGHDYISTVTAPTCTEGGYTTYVCSRCQDTYTSDETAALGHDFATEWSSDADGHWHACSRCGAKADATAHSFAWVVDKEATATEAGSKHERCSVCGYAKAAVEIPATGTSSGTAARPGALPQTGDPTSAALPAALAGVLLATIGLATRELRRR